jgi:agmatinase
MAHHPQLDALCTGPLTLLGAPFSRDLAQARAAVLGLPFDCGTHLFRVGARQGPSAIREQSRLVRPFNPERSDYNPMQRLGLIDCGDVRVIPSRILEAFAAIEAAMRVIVSAGVVPITMGGDGSVSLPQMRALHATHGPLAVIHIDSHTDTMRFTAGDEYNAGTQFTHAALEKLVDPSRVYHIGVRGSTYQQGGFAYVREFGYQVITFTELMQRGIASVLEQLHTALRGHPVVLCFDMDAFDPACAPGVATPSWGGLSAREGLDIVRGLAGLDLVAVDVNTVSPAHDHQGMTASLAAHVLYEALVVLCQRFGLDQTD